MVLIFLYCLVVVLFENKISFTILQIHFYNLPTVLIADNNFLFSYLPRKVVACDFVSGFLQLVCAQKRLSKFFYSSTAAIQ